MPPVTSMRQQPPVRGSVPRAVFADSPGALPYADPRRRRGWLMFPDTLLSRAAGIARVLGMVLFVGAVIFAAFAYDEYERATRRLTVPFPERSEEDWGRPQYVQWRHDVARQQLRYTIEIGGAGLVMTATGAAYEWRRRRRARGL